METLAKRRVGTGNPGLVLKIPSEVPEQNQESVNVGFHFAVRNSCLPTVRVIILSTQMVSDYEIKTSQFLANYFLKLRHSVFLSII